MKKYNKDIGLAVVGCGTIGRIRSIMARDYPGIGWIGLCDLNEDLGNNLKKDCNADYFTTSYEELLKRNEVSAVIIATDENHHFGPTMAAIEAGASIFIEKPLATDLTESRKVLDAITEAKIDAVKSEPPLPRVTLFPKLSLAINPGITTILFLTAL